MAKAVPPSAPTATAWHQHHHHQLQQQQQQQQQRGLRTRTKPHPLFDESEIISTLRHAAEDQDSDEEGFLPEDDFSDDEGVAEGQAARRTPKIDEQGRAYGLGRRKTAVARVWITPGNGQFLVNRSPLAERFPRDALQNDILDPLFVTGAMALFDVKAVVSGGGTSGQAGALRHGLARALDNYQPSLRTTLRTAGFMTRDPRMVERKKPGQPKARKKKQWVKR
jgi:small subunit ribosomal protein S9